METFNASTADAAPIASHGPVVNSRLAVASWILYDVGNTVFSMGVLSLNFPIFVKETVGEAKADVVYGLLTAGAMGLTFLLAPVLGAMTDRAARRMPFLIASTVLSAAATILLPRFGFMWSAVLFVLGNLGFQAGVVFFDALLPAVSHAGNRGFVTGLAVGLGYLGSYVAVGISLIFGTGNWAMIFGCIGLVFLALALPCFIFVSEPENLSVARLHQGIFIEVWRQAMHTLRDVDSHPGLLRFLLARVFYTDATNTVIAVMTLFTISVAKGLGYSEAKGRVTAYTIMMAAITVAIAGGVTWGWLADRAGPRRTLRWVLRLWMVTLLFGLAVGLLRLPLWSLFVLAGLAGIALAGVGASDRPLMLRLTPPGRVGEFYGLYGMVGRFGAITGPAVWGACNWIAGRCGLTVLQSECVGLAALLLMVVAGYAMLGPQARPIPAAVTA